MTQQPEMRLVPDEYAVDERAKALFAQAWPDRRWMGRQTNRTYYRRIARGQLHREAKADAILSALGGRS